MISWETKKQKKTTAWCLLTVSGKCLHDLIFVWLLKYPRLLLIENFFNWLLKYFLIFFFSSVVSSLCADLNRLSLCKNPTRRCTEQTDLLGKVKATSRKIGFEIARNTDINGSPNKFFHCYWDREIHQTWFIRDYFHCCRRRKLCCSPGTVEEKAKIGERSPYFELISIWLNTDAFVSTVEYFSPWWNQFSGVFLQDCLSAYDSHL